MQPVSPGGTPPATASDPTKPKQLGYFNTWRESDPYRGSSFYDGALGVKAPGDGFIYVAESGRGLMIFQQPAEQ